MEIRNFTKAKVKSLSITVNGDGTKVVVMEPTPYDYQISNVFLLNTSAYGGRVVN